MSTAWLLLLVAGSASAACPAVSPVEWSGRLDAAERAFADLDEPAFDVALDGAAVALGCLDGTASPSLAARYHRLVGLRLYARRDEATAGLAFAAARAVEPFGVLSSAVVPPGHEVHTLAATAATPGRTVAVRRPRDGQVWFDGVASLTRPADRPTLAQIVVADVVVTSAYLTPSDPMPPYTPSWVPTRTTGRWAVGGGGVALAATSAVLYGIAVGVGARLEGPLDPLEYDRAAVEALQGRANGLVVGSVTTGIAGGVAIGWAVLR